MLALGWGRPLGDGGSGGWDWWTLAGAIALFIIIETARAKPPMAVAIVLAGIGGLVIGDLTRVWGMVPVWGTMLLIVLSRNLLRRRGRPQV
jgi:hypothetical protein